MENNIYTVYAHVNKANNMVYVGMTCQRPERRWKEGAGYHSKRFVQAIKDFGWDGFDHIVIKDKLTETEACELEKAIIKAFDLTNVAKGYNIAEGGEPGGMTNHHHSEEAKEKIREARKRDGFTEEHKRHISEAKSGVKHHCAKKVYQYTKDRKTFIKEWSYMNEAAITLGIVKNTISECCRGKRPSAGGYWWTYEKEAQNG